MPEAPARPASFRDLRLSPEIQAVLDSQGFVTPTPIQARAIPEALRGRDVLGKAQTGTGKTLAFGIPLISRIDPTRVSAQSLILLPTRELAQQVAENLEVVAAARGLKVALLVGGEKVRFQRARIPGRQIVVGTPGRVLDLLRERLLHLEWVDVLVLDEFDRMLDMGFIDDVKRIIAFLPKERQTMLFSATVPPEIRRLALDLMSDPLEIEVAAGLRTAEGVSQQALRLHALDKLEVLFRLLDADMKSSPEETVLVFANTRIAVSELDRELFGRGLPSAALSGDYEQTRRFQVMDGFREKRIRILVATDVASRGLDVDHVGHVINYDVPLEPEDYVHRIGRTARAGRKGRVTTLVVPAQERAFRRILERLGKEIRCGRVAVEGGGPRRVLGGAEESLRLRSSRGAAHAGYAAGRSGSVGPRFGGGARPSRDSRRPSERPRGGERGGRPSGRDSGRSSRGDGRGRSRR